jgi:CBS domain-containing protein
MTLYAKDVMSKTLLTVEADTSLLELEGRLRMAGIGGAPVVDRGKLVGIVSRSDIARQLTVEDTYAELARDLFVAAEPKAEADDAIGDQVGRRLRELRVGDAMVTNIDTVRPDLPVTEVARTMLENHHRRVIVEDADGTILGIVTASDIVRLVAEGKAAGA